MSVSRHCLVVAWLCLAGVLLLSATAAGNSADPACSFGRLPYSCYIGCPAHCDESVQSCVNECVSGCFCPAGLFQLGSQLCVQQQQCLDIGEVDAIPVVDKCSQYEDCSECISSDPDCQWCPYLPGEKAVKGSHCRQRELNPFCPEKIVDPTPLVNIINNFNYTDVIQIQPQKLQLQLRTGEPAQFTLQFRPSRNFPLDVYFLLDLTGSFSQRFRDTVTPLATDLVAALEGISSQYAVAFGGFGDKRTIPYALPSQDPSAYRTGFNLERCTNQLITDVDDCNPTVSFRHMTSLSSLTTDELQEVLSNITIHPNVDSLEGGMDGLVQVLTCTNAIGWRQPSLRMLLYMSNANFHLAGDGKVGAAFQPNPGECFLEQRVDENGQTVQDYTKDMTYDYPSVYQLRQLIQQSQTNVVFAISSRGPASSSPYLDLKNELKLGSMLQITSLETDSSNLVSVIRSSYDNITQEIRLTPNKELSQVTFSYSHAENCTLSENGQVCSDITLDSSVSLVVTVNMTSCLLNTTTVSLRSAAFGAVELELVPLCQCDCSLEQEPAAEECSGAGTLVCGVCQCEEGRSGPECECEGEVTNNCKSEVVTEECSGRGRGECDCGQCVCHVQEELLRTRNVTMCYFGDQCQCDHLTSCGGISEEGELCSGRGTCDCPSNKCVCTATAPLSGRLYTGDMCECSPDSCFNENFPSRTCVYTGTLSSLGDAECGCNTCLCDVNGNNAIPAGDGTCVAGPPPCSRKEGCARCAKDLQSPSTDCDQLINEGCDPILLSDDDSVPESHDRECTFQDDDCTRTFYISLSLTSVFVEPRAECGTTGGGLNDLIWIIPVSIVGAILLLGLLALLIVLCVFWALDRHEFSKFQSTLEEADWDPRVNPIYVSPTQDYTNVAYKRTTRRWQD